MRYEPFSPTVLNLGRGMIFPALVIIMVTVHAVGCSNPFLLPSIKPNINMVKVTILEWHNRDAATGEQWNIVQTDEGQRFVLPCHWGEVGDVFYIPRETLEYDSHNGSWAWRYRHPTQAELIHMRSHPVPSPTLPPKAPFIDLTTDLETEE